LLDAVLSPGSLRERLEVTGPIGDSVSAELGWIDDETAIFESATACGLALLQPEERDPLRTTTRGVGELIWEAADRGAKTVVVGLGGSATVDGGTGAARGLGWTFQNAAGQALAEGGGSLADLDTLGPGWALHARVVGLADVTTPLIGDDGAAPIFGPQKGARPEEIVRLVGGGARVLCARGTQPGGRVGAGPGGV
jgi:glycerate kinase